MVKISRSGRPRASSPGEISEAACELFLEQGYEKTSISQIAQRAGVSRSSFFNYFTSKADVLWSGLDERIEALARQLRSGNSDNAPERIRVSVMGIATDFAPDSLALALVNAQAMDLAGELELDSALRQARIGSLAAEQLQRSGIDELTASVRGAAYGGAVLAALRTWARAGAGRTSLAAVLEKALSAAK
ncbi:AcrR family transcriptional regulator [Microbacterium endophyticum]|uniref:AcrR family transcriptional regulator n=1 Tax=Microbacterium endophyticum TaxID=1526412 RepID=A0A7W4V0J1_9MICO|nr:TetR/AcrR family transcriptional regulator [Microbacterium endophyticum]MBB2974638.1 AcrR family transcriptional regulator [Microbacterium endophyticum]NIK36935.1 AcrR family transcriptional regulator [Microbacterium endophyticum]